MGRASPDLALSSPLVAVDRASVEEHHNHVRHALTPDGRIRLLTFANTVTEAFAFQHGGASAPVERVSSGGLTSLYDAFAAALMSMPQSDRPQLVFGVTDGRENASALKPHDVVALAASSGASLYMSFSPRGVRQEGWHELVVRTRDRRYVVRARAGYQG